MNIIKENEHVEGDNIHITPLLFPKGYTVKGLYDLIIKRKCLEVILNMNQKTYDKLHDILPKLKNEIDKGYTTLHIRILRTTRQDVEKRVKKIVPYGLVSTEEIDNALKRMAQSYEE